MKNIEKFNDKIIDIALSGKCLAVNKRTLEPCSCKDIKCIDCIGHDYECNTLLKEWANAEYAEYVEHCPFEKGELVEVSDYGDLWCLRYFSYISSDTSHKYRTVRNLESDITEGWNYCRKYGTLGSIAKENDNEE